VHISNIFIRHLYELGKKGSIIINKEFLPRLGSLTQLGDSLYRYVANYLLLSIIKNIPHTELNKSPTLALVFLRNISAFLLRITGSDLSTASDGLRAFSHEAGFKDERVASNRLLYLMEMAVSRRVNVSKALLLVENALAGRVEWDVYYDLVRSLFPGK
jgi:hypothetical protein